MLEEDELRMNKEEENERVLLNKYFNERFSIRCRCVLFTKLREEEEKRNRESEKAIENYVMERNKSEEPKDNTP